MAGNTLTASFQDDAGREINTAEIPRDFQHDLEHTFDGKLVPGTRRIEVSDATGEIIATYSCGTREQIDALSAKSGTVSPLAQDNPYTKAAGLIHIVGEGESAINAPTSYTFPADVEVKNFEDDAASFPAQVELARQGYRSSVILHDSQLEGRAGKYITFMAAIDEAKARGEEMVIVQKPGQCLLFIKTQRTAFATH